jgi:predicted MFS family arabinose efflux permease
MSQPERAPQLHNLSVKLDSNPNFRRLWTAGVFSNIADGIGLSAAPLLAATFTRDPALVAGLVVAQRLPWFIFTLISGALVDRLNRRQIMVLANVARALALGLLSLTLFTACRGLWTLYATFFILGISETLNDNAALAILPAIVPKEQLERANGRIFATMSLTNEFVGPPLGSLLYAWIPFIPFFFSGASFGAAAWLLQRMTGDFFPAERQSLTFRRLTSEIGEGMRWFWQNRVIRTCSIWAAMANFTGAATSGVFVLFAQEKLGLSEAGFGLLLAGGAVGGTLGGLCAEWLAARVGSGGAVFLSNILPAAAFAIMAVTTNPILAAFLLALLSGASMIGNVVVTVLRQAAIPSDLLGRVTSAYRMIALGTLPLGAAVGGLVARNFSLTAPYWMSAILMLLTAFALLPVLNNRSIREAQGDA